MMLCFYYVIRYIQGNVFAEESQAKEVNVLSMDD